MRVPVKHAVTCSIGDVFESVFTAANKRPGAAVVVAAARTGVGGRASLRLGWRLLRMGPDS